MTSVRQRKLFQVQLRGFPEIGYGFFYSRALADYAGFGHSATHRSSSLRKTAVNVRTAIDVIMTVLMLMVRGLAREPYAIIRFPSAEVG